MLQRTALAFALLAALACAPDRADAKDLRGKLGVGALRSLSGAEGLSIRYWPTRSLGVEILGGIALAERPTGDNRVGLAAGLQIQYVLRELGAANFIAGVRGTFGYLNNNAVVGAPPSNDALTQLAVELPLTVEYHFADAFSIQLSFGLLLSKVDPQGPIFEAAPLAFGGDDREGLVFGIGSGGLLGSAGFTFYF